MELKNLKNGTTTTDKHSNSPAVTISAFYSMCLSYVAKDIYCMLRQVMKITSPAFDALFTPELKQLSKLFKDYNYELRIAGGAVRDLLMNITPSDVDFASTATPTQMIKLFNDHSIRTLHKRGEEHGTVTCRINEKENFEVTTLRVDVLCDGRRAEVQFTTNWQKDAFRRDLTINSLFLDLNGTIYDYTGGIKDIEERRVQFVGDPTQRLQEDYLRILRYFRFFGRIAKDPNDHLVENIEAIVACRDGLANVSGERIWIEFSKILVGRFAVEIVEKMLSFCNLGPVLGLVGFDNDEDSNRERIAEFKRVAGANLVPETGKLNCEPATALAALLLSPEEVNVFRNRVKFSKAEHVICDVIVKHRDEAKRHADDVKFFKDFVQDLVFSGGTEIKEEARHKCIQLLKYIGARDVEKQIIDWTMEVFPINGLVLMNNNVEKGIRLRAVSTHLFNLWKESDYKSTCDELLKHTSEPAVAAIEEQLKKKKLDFGTEPSIKKKRRKN